ncbi:MAG: LysR substrate-binding domain-containing protein [Gordonia sp. (in: high G+C Gram-positive bacteria)]
MFALIEDAVRAFPETPVTVRQVFPDSFHDELLAGDLDLVLRRGVDTPPDLTSAIAAYQPLRLAVNARHPFAGRDCVGVRELADRPIMVWAPPRQSFYTDFLVAHCRRSGIEPVLRIDPVQGTPPSTAVLVDDEACAFVSDPPGPLHDGRVVVVELDSPLLSPVQALWLGHTVSDFRAAVLAGRDAQAVTPPGDRVSR